jgi:hypothetical protein
MRTPIEEMPFGIRAVPPCFVECHSERVYLTMYALKQWKNRTHDFRETSTLRDKPKHIVTVDLSQHAFIELQVTS